MAWTRTLLFITVMCFVAVSSVAAVHAFPADPSRGGSSNITAAITNIQKPVMSPDCHQQESDLSQSSVSACDIFCATLANMISNETVDDVTLSANRAEFVFMTRGLHTREPALEPHPPK